MKITKKLIPLISGLTTSIVITTPLLTSCSDVFTDVIALRNNKGAPNYVQASGTYSEEFATRKYFEEFDFSKFEQELLWTATIEIDELPELYKDSRPNFKITRGLINMTDVNVDRETHTLSYKLNLEYEYQFNQKIEGIGPTASGEHDAFITELQFDNIKFNLKKDVFGENHGGLIPEKYHLPTKDYPYYYGDWFEGNERISFNIRHERKGFSEDGIQNYAFENRYGAIVDDQHKYTPELDEILTNQFLHYSFYMDKIQKA